MTPLASGLTIADKYVLGKRLGSGGMGSVWSARHLQLDVEVAIKFIDLARASDEAPVRFEREAKACAKLQSPNIVRVHDYGVEDETPYIVMELIEGETLADRLKRNGRLGIAETAEILSQVCNGLRHAHGAGIVHRDIKPTNIFIAKVLGDETAKIVDFGIAKSAAFTGLVTTAGCLIGTPRYMSPEQASRSKEVDHRSDLWSLGVVVFRCLTGRYPFAGRTLGDLLLAVCSAPVPVPSQIAPDLGSDVDRFFERALARNPDERFQSAREMAAAFAAIAGAPAPEPSVVSITAPSAVASRPSTELVASRPAPAPASVPGSTLRYGFTPHAATLPIPIESPLASSPAPEPRAPSTPLTMKTLLLDDPPPAPPAATTKPAAKPETEVLAPKAVAKPEAPAPKPLATSMGGHSVDPRPTRRRRRDLWAVAAAVVVLGGVAGVVWKLPARATSTTEPTTAAIEVPAITAPAPSTPEPSSAPSPEPSTQPSAEPASHDAPQIAAPRPTASQRPIYAAAPIASGAHTRPAWLASAASAAPAAAAPSAAPIANSDSDAGAAPIASAAADGAAHDEGPARTISADLGDVPGATHEAPANDAKSPTALVGDDVGASSGPEAPPSAAPSQTR